MVRFDSHPDGWADPLCPDDWVPVSGGWHEPPARTVLGPKLCQRCGSEFTQRKTEGPKRFSERKFCRRFCYHPNDIKGWTPERVDWLKRLRAEGCSKSVIADRMGITRNAVVGKLYRLKPPHVDTTIARPAANQFGPGENSRQGPRRPHIKGKRPPLAEFNAAIPKKQRKSLIELYSEKGAERGLCHWPVGEVGSPGFFFCGARVDSAPYCPAHDHYAHHSEVVACPASTIVRRQPTYLLVPGKTMPGYLRGAARKKQNRL